MWADPTCSGPSSRRTWRTSCTRACSRAARRCPTSPKSSPATAPARCAARPSARGGLDRRLRAAVQRGAAAERPRREWTETLLDGHAARPALLPADEEGQRRRADGSSARIFRARSGSRAKEIHERLCDDCLVVDVRPKEAFAAAHIPGLDQHPARPEPADLGGVGAAVRQAPRDRAGRPRARCPRWSRT